MTLSKEVAPTTAWDKKNQLAAELAQLATTGEFVRQERQGDRSIAIREDTGGEQLSTATYLDYERVAVGEPLMQGDVLETLDEPCTPWSRHLIIVTADCDLAHDKHAGRVTCVPLLTCEEFLYEITLPRFREQQIAKYCGRLQKVAEGAGHHISPTRLREWALEAVPDELAADLSLEGSAAVEASRLAKALQRLESRGGDLAADREALADAITATGVDLKNARAQVQERVRQAFVQPPGDSLFVSAAAPALQGGYFAYLRHLEQVMEPTISVGASTKGKTHLRVGRLGRQLTHALVQRFGMVFMSVGLPTEYESLRDLHADELLESFI